MTTTAVIGSSLGGFYATWLAERWACKAALLNPAVLPARDLAAHLGDQTVWHDPEQHFVFEAAYVDELITQEIAHITRPERYFTVIAKGDEVLDWCEMRRHYAGASIKLLPGGDHALSDYHQHLDAVGPIVGPSVVCCHWGIGFKGCGCLEAGHQAQEPAMHAEGVAFNSDDLALLSPYAPANSSALATTPPNLSLSHWPAKPFRIRPAHCYQRKEHECFQWASQASTRAR